MGISNSENENEVFTGLKKAAVIMVALDHDASGQLFRYLPETDVQSLTRQVSKLDSVNAERVEQILAEFHELALTQQHLTSGGVEHAKRMLQSAFGADRAQFLVNRVIKSIGSDFPTFDSIERADPSRVAKFLQGEHPQTIALVLAHISPNAAAGMLMALPAETRADVSMRMAQLEQISPEVIRRIAEILQQKLESLGQFSQETQGGVPAVAEMLNRLEGQSGQELLEQIEAENKDLAIEIRNLMFVFDDLLLIDKMGMREILTRADKRQLTVALKGANEKLREHFFDNMSERGGAMVKEDMEAMGPIKIAEVEESQAAIIEVVRQLEAEGVLSLQGAVGEQYVV